MKLGIHSNRGLAVKKLKALSAPRSHAAGCQFSKPGRRRREPWKGLKENNLSLGDPALQFTSPEIGVGRSEVVVPWITRTSPDGADCGSTTSITML